MKKEFLDEIYDLRQRVINDIKLHESYMDCPISRCCENMEYQNENVAELRIRRSQLESIDELILKYINLH